MKDIFRILSQTKFVSGGHFYVSYQSLIEHIVCHVIVICYVTVLRGNGWDISPISYKPGRHQIKLLQLLSCDMKISPLQSNNRSNNSYSCCCSCEFRIFLFYFLKELQYFEFRKNPFLRLCKNMSVDDLTNGNTKRKEKLK